MKNLKYIILFTPIILIAQNNLFFNRVLTFKLNANQEIIVPTNKAWHVKSTNYTSIGFKTTSPEYGNAVGAQGFNIDFGEPWLGEGDVLVGYSNNQTFSVLEYDVIPISSGVNASSTFSGSVSGGAGQYTASNDYTTAESFIDIDGNEYGAVNVGGIIWSTSDLKVTNFSDGTPILQVFNGTEMKNTEQAAYYINNNGEVIYNWWAIVGDHDGNSNTPAKKLAPEGYRVTSVVDWKRLVDFYGGEDTAASYLVSKNWPFFPGLDKAGLNLMPVNNWNTSGIAYGWGTTSYRSKVSNWFGEFHTFNITTVDQNNSPGSFGYLINYNVATFTMGGVSSTYTSALPVRVVKEY